MWRFFKEMCESYLLRELVGGYTDCKNMRSMINIKFDASMSCES
jgi:hypothetical protein